MSALGKLTVRSLELKWRTPPPKIVVVERLGSCSCRKHSFAGTRACHRLTLSSCRAASQLLHRGRFFVVQKTVAALVWHTLHCIFRR